MLNAPLWESFDVIGAGLGAMNLTPCRSPTLQQMIQGWQQTIQNTYAPFQQRYNKPFIAVENGCFAVEGCANWGSYCPLMPDAKFDESKTDLQLMRNYYLSQDVAFQPMEGYFGPGWHYYSFTPYACGGVRDSSVNPRLKVEDIIQFLFLGEERPRIITIDGRLGDWLESYRVLNDPVADSRGKQDLTSLSFAQDEEYMYFRVDYVLPPTGFLSVELDTNGDMGRDAFLLLNNVYSLDGTWWGNSFLYEDRDKIGFVDSIDASNSIEMRVAKRFLIKLLTEYPVRARLVHCDRNWRTEDETTWIALPEWDSK